MSQAIAAINNDTANNVTNNLLYNMNLTPDDAIMQLDDATTE